MDAAHVCVVSIQYAKPIKKGQHQMSSQQRVDYAGVRAHEERAAGLYRRDVRRLGETLSDGLDSSTLVALYVGILGVASMLVPALIYIAPFLIAPPVMIHMGRKDPMRLPFRLPRSANRRDYGHPLPGRRGYHKASGLAHVGNAIEHERREIWSAKSDELTHRLVIGTTGAGKTVMLVGEVANYLSIGGGVIYVDAKAAPSLPWDLAALARRVGREDDLLTINYMTGNTTVGPSGAQRLTNTANPLAVGSGDSLVQMVSSLIPAPEGDNAVFGERALNMVTGLLYALVDLRDAGHIDMGVGTLRDSLPLESYEKLAFDGRLRTDAARAATMAYLKSLPQWQPPSERKAEPISDEAYRQHGFAQMYFTRALSSLTDTYGHIYFGVQGEVDFVDAVRQRRIVSILLPALEKSPAELANLGKINLSALRDAISSGLGGQIEGTRRDVLESLPTASAIPSKIICDEYGYMAVEGFAIVAAQARGLGFSVTFAGQDWAGIKRGSETEADQIWSNCKIKIFGTLLDNETLQRLQAAVGEADVTEAKGFALGGMGVGGYMDDLTAGVSRRIRVDVRDLANQTEGEAHIVIGGNMIRANTFYAAHDNANLPSYHINRFLRIGERLAIDRDAATAKGEGASKTLDMRGTSAGGAGQRAGSHGGVTSAHGTDDERHPSESARARARAHAAGKAPTMEDLRAASVSHLGVDEGQERGSYAQTAQRRSQQPEGAGVGFPPDAPAAGKSQPAATHESLAQAAEQAAEQTQDALKLMEQDSAHVEEAESRAALDRLDSNTTIARAAQAVERDMEIVAPISVPISDLQGIDLRAALAGSMYGKASDEAAADQIEQAVNHHPDAELNERADQLSVSELRSELQSAVNHFLGR